ncbi:hypothetical protein [Bradyrhizobium sp.]|uniref:hypothetical protein n=1 Tax=Bradyrhizobium sp. TaxID=376 RepID=UPI0025C25096|nr:hypothetical protein [Bradyrhizobium sp.]
MRLQAAFSGEVEPSENPADTSIAISSLRQQKCSSIDRLVDASRRECSHIAVWPVSGINKPMTYRGGSRGPRISSRPAAKCFCHDEVFIVMISLLFCASASSGLAIGFICFRAVAILLVSPFVAFLPAALLLYHGFGLIFGVMISAACLATLQSLYLVGALMRSLMMDNEQGKSSSSNAVCSIRRHPGMNHDAIRRIEPGQVE